MKSFVDQIKKGGVIAYPTETIWGLGADIFNDSAIDKIYDIKSRSDSKAISVLVRDIDMAQPLAKISKKVEQLMFMFWPGPLSIVLPCSQKVSKKIHRGTGFVGLRNSSHPWVQEFFNNYPAPITTTSINKSQEPPARTYAEVSWLPKEVLVVKDLNALQKNSQGSTVIKIVNDQVKILREGPINKEQIFSFWNAY